MFIFATTKGYVALSHYFPIVVYSIYLFERNDNKINNNKNEKMSFLWRIDPRLSC